MTAWANGFIGVASGLWIGVQVLGLEPLAAAQCMAASVISALLSVLVTLQMERHSWIKRVLLPGPWRTWAIFLTMYFGGMFLMAPALHSSRAFGWLFVPLVLATGFTIVAFGPIQDRIMVHLQRKSRAKIRARTPADSIL